jgi:hypothetical protein
MFLCPLCFKNLATELMQNLKEINYLVLYHGLDPHQGYSQALTNTWDDYMDETGNSRAKRNNFKDSTDFIGWYASKGYYQGFQKADARSLYLAYHDGYGGFKKKTYRKKQWLIAVSDRVQARSSMYQQQYWGCAEELKKKRFWIF